jgi:uncharacterized repeat protein (TIGR01451 family)
MLIMSAPGASAARSALAAPADPPSSASTAVSLIINRVEAAGIPGFAGTYGIAATGPSGGTDTSSFPDPDGVRAYVSVAAHTSVTSGEPSIPTFFGRTDLTAVSGPSLTAGGPHPVDLPGLLHNFAQCTPPHPVMTDSHILPPVTFGHTLANGVPVTVSVTGAQLGLPAVEDGTLTITMTTIKESTGTTSAAVRTVITIDGTLNGTGGTALYSGPLATLTLGDVSAQCSSGPTPADVQVTKDAPATVTPGGVITYVLTVVDNGPGAASDVTVQDELNAGLTGITGLPSGCSLTGRTVLCDLGTMALGEVREIRFSATLEPGVPPGGLIENCGTGYTSTPETDYANNESCVATAVESPLVPPSAETDIAMTKTGPAVVSPGGTVSYTLTVSNNSSSVGAHNVQISDVLGEELSAVTGVPAGCTLAGRALACGVGTLPAGETRTFTVTGTAAPDLTPGEVIENCAAAQTSTPETDYANNESCLATAVEPEPVPPPAETDVAITKTGPASVRPGEAVSYTLTVSNNSSSVDAHNVQISDVLGEGLTPVEARPGCTLAGQVLACDVGTLPAGETRIFRITAVAGRDVRPRRVIENCGTVYTSTPETDYGNNESCVATAVEPEPVLPQTDLVIVKSGPASVLPGETVSYTLTLVNHGKADAVQVVVSDVFDSELIAVTGVPAGCTLAGQLLTCEVGTLPAGETRIFRITAVAGQDVQPGRVIENCGTTYSATPDTDYMNNASCVHTTVEQPAVPPPSPSPTTPSPSPTRPSPSPTRPSPSPTRPSPSPTKPYPMPSGPAPTGGGTALTGFNRPLVTAGLALGVLGVLIGAGAARRRTRRQRMTGRS